MSQAIYEEFSREFLLSMSSVTQPRAAVDKVIADGHLKKISQYFTERNPISLLYKVWFDVFYYFLFTEKDVESVRHFGRGSFALRMDKKQRSYITLVTPSNATIKLERRMYEIPGSSQCPVASFLSYVNHLHPNIVQFWQRPREVYRPSEPGIWYDMFPLGLQKMARMMTHLSQLACLPITYRISNIRMTALKHLELAGASPSVVRFLLLRGARGHEGGTQMKPCEPDGTPCCATSACRGATGKIARAQVVPCKKDKQECCATATLRRASYRTTERWRREAVLS